MPTYELFVKMREENTTYPKHRKKNDYLLAGHMKCACNLTWRARTAAHRRSRKGEWVERKTPDQYILLSTTPQEAQTAGLSQIGEC